MWSPTSAIHPIHDKDNKRSNTSNEGNLRERHLKLVGVELPVM